MDARSMDNNFAFPDLATRALDEAEAASDKLDFPVGGDEPLGIFRGLVAAAMIQIGVLLFAALVWQLWHFLR